MSFAVQGNSLNIVPRFEMSEKSEPLSRTEVVSQSSSVNTAQGQSLKGMAASLDRYSERLRIARGQADAVAVAVTTAACGIPVSGQGVAEFVHTTQVKSAEAVKSLSALGDSLEGCQVQGHLLEAEQRKMLASFTSPACVDPEFAAETLKQLQALPGGPVQNNTYQRAAASGTSDFFADLNNMIDFIKGGYLSPYEVLLTRYTAFYKQFNEDVMSKMGGWVTGKDDGKRIEVNGDLYSELESFTNQYSVLAQDILYPSGANNIYGGVGKDEAEKWAQAFGQDKSNVAQLLDGSYVVKLDMGPINSMMSGLDALGMRDTVTLDSAKFQAWQTGFNTQESELKNKLQMFTTKYGNANSYHENFNKILSSQLSQYAEMLKAIVSGIG